MPPSATPRLPFSELLRKNQPQAAAWVTGNTNAPQLSGLVKFYETPYEGILIEAELFGLPNIHTSGSSNFYAMHIHENGDCSWHFTKTGEHYNPQNQPHPQHAGDLLPLWGIKGMRGKPFMINAFLFPIFLGAL